MGTTSNMFYGPDGTLVVNSSTSSMDEIAGAAIGLMDIRMPNQDLDPGLRTVLDTLGSWSAESQRPGRRLGGLLDRDQFLGPENVLAKVRMARKCLADDVVGTAVDVTESLALSAMSIFTLKDDEQDVWNQWAALIDLDSRMREMWQILMTDSMVVGATWWERHTFKLRGTTELDNERRMTKDLVVPTSLSFLDSTKVCPVGTMNFQRNGLAYIASAEEAEEFDKIIAERDGRPVLVPETGPRRSYLSMTSNATSSPSGLDDDDVVRRLVRKRYRASGDELKDLQAAGVDCTNLFLLDSRFTFRHTLTKPTYDRYPQVRFERLFPILDAKSHLRSSDRATLIGASKYIILITQGSDKHPGLPAEIEALKAGAVNLGVHPIVVGDARLKIELIAPKTDMTLTPEKYDVLDVRLTGAVYGTFAATGSDSDDPIKTGRVIGAGLEGRRRMMRRILEAQVFDRMRLSNDWLTGRAKLRYHPEKISLVFDSAWANTLLDLREANEISRETMLSQLGLDQSDEFALRKREKARFDDVFETFVPHGANPNRSGQPALPPGEEPAKPTRLAQRQGGRRRGGNRNGGGAAPGTGQGQETTDPRRSREAKSRDEWIASLPERTRKELIAEAGEYEIPGRHQMNRAQLIDALVEETDEDGGPDAP